MTFTYTFDFSIDRNRIRFELGDVTSDAALYQDEEIDAALTSAASWQAAVIMLIDGLIARYARTTGFTADWLKVDAMANMKAFMVLRERKVDEYGLAADGEIVSDGTHVYRYDSDQTDEPDYQE